MCNCPWRRKTATTQFNSSGATASFAFQAFYKHVSLHLFDRCHGGECNTLICPQLAMHGVSSCGTHRVVTHSRKMRSSAHGTSCATSPVFCDGKEACSEEQGTTVSRRWSVCRNGYVFQTVAKVHVVQNTFCSVSFLTRAVVV